MDFDASKDVIFLILMQVDRSDWRKKFITNTHLEGMDTVLVGGLIPEVTIDMEQKYGDPNQTSNFTGCLSGTLWGIFCGGGGDGGVGEEHGFIMVAIQCIDQLNVQSNLIISRFF